MLSGGGGLSKYMMASGSDDGEDELDEQDLKDDPIYNLDLRVSLESYSTLVSDRSAVCS